VHNVRRNEMNGPDDHTPADPARVVLAQRRNAGVQVTLLWAKGTSAVVILVRDEGNDDQFELSVEPGANAFDTFEHPYAYAAWRGVDYRLGDVRRAA
jgi:hypothetical protein